MKKTAALFMLIIPVLLMAQSPGLYNGTEGLYGNELRSKLHEITKNHHCLSYYYSKYVLLESDADPAVPGNVILVYTGRSQNGLDYGTGGNQIQREHVWAKSHGDFNEVLPMFSDIHNLKPADASVNSSRSNLDFDNGGYTHPEATGCKYDDDSWEPRDQVKGDIARIIFYMDARYEGGAGEIDLKVKDAVDNYPNPWHGKLSALLQWNIQDPPDAFERNRNNVIASYQGNRNPFIDNPDFANLIWGNAQPTDNQIGNISAYPIRPSDSEEVTVSCTVVNVQASTPVKLYWGNGYDYLENELTMQKTGDDYSAIIPPQPAGSTVYFVVQAFDVGQSIKSLVYNYSVINAYTGTVLPINEIQGAGDETPYYLLEVTTTGIVTASGNNGYFLQDQSGPRNGIYVYDPGRKPKIGDSLVVTGVAKEYYFLTEIGDVTDFVRVAQDVPLPEPSEITAAQVGEDYEGTLVRIRDGICTYATPWENYDMWRVNDGTGILNVKNTDVFEMTPVIGQIYTITGPLTYDYSEWKVELRWLQDVMNPVGIHDTPEFVQLIAYPNPVSDRFTVIFPENSIEAVNVKFFDLLGKERMSQQMNVENGKLTISLEKLKINPGLYFLIFEDENLRAISKIVVNK